VPLLTTRRIVCPRYTSSRFRESGSNAKDREELDMCLAVPGRVITIEGDGELRTARVDFGGVTREASLCFVPETEVGDYVLVHVGFAITRVDEDVARETLEALQSIGELERTAEGERDASP
jgi:hydrogenase expression/formation protein HypC